MLPRSRGHPGSAGYRLQRELGWQILESAKNARGKAVNVSSVYERRYPNGLANVVRHHNEGLVS